MVSVTRWQNCAKLYKQIMSLVSNNSLEIAISLHESGDYVTSVKYLEQALDHPLALYLLAVTLREGWSGIKDKRRAVDLLRTSISVIIREIPLASKRQRESISLERVRLSLSKKSSQSGSLLNLSSKGADFPDRPNRNKRNSDAPFIPLPNHLKGLSQIKEKPEPSSSLMKAVLGRGESLHHVASETSKAISKMSSKSRSGDIPMHSLPQRSASHIDNQKMGQNLPPSSSRPTTAPSSRPTTAPSLSTVSESSDGESVLNVLYLKSILCLPVLDLGYSFLYGWGVRKDSAIAIFYFDAAALLGDLDAQLELGHMYENGIGIKQNKYLAAKYYRMIPDNERMSGLSWIWKVKYNQVLEFDIENEKAKAFERLKTDPIHQIELKRKKRMTCICF